MICIIILLLISTGYAAAYAVFAFTHKNPVAGAAMVFAALLPLAPAAALLVRMFA